MDGGAVHSQASSSLRAVNVQPHLLLPVRDRDVAFGGGDDNALFLDDGGLKSFVRSTLMVRMFPSTVISTFFITFSPFSPGYAPSTVNLVILNLYLYS